VRRARFTSKEVVDLTLHFYKRNYIEGLFLSSGIIRSSDYTMEQIVEVARSIRQYHDFRGYIHLKTIPDADPAIITKAGRFADRVSINIELPSAEGLQRLAPEKSETRIEGAMADMRAAIEDGADARKRFRSAPRFAPGGQSTQMIVGADSATDHDIVLRASTLYTKFKLRRIYYSAFSPIPHASAVLPLKRPPLMREHRLYQSDWLMRFYHFTPKEIGDAVDPVSKMLPLDIDPKLAWALRFRDRFPIDLNRAPKEVLLRVPGLGVRAVSALINARRLKKIRLEDVARVTVSLKKLLPFIVTSDWRPVALSDRADLRPLVAPKPMQLGLFSV
jgi:putative DNA modification/repair radical SAM protein